MVFLGSDGVRRGRGEGEEEGVGGEKPGGPLAQVYQPPGSKVEGADVSKRKLDSLIFHLFLGGINRTTLRTSKTNVYYVLSHISVVSFL